MYGKGRLVVLLLRNPNKEALAILLYRTSGESRP